MARNRLKDDKLAMACGMLIANAVALRRMALRHARERDALASVVARSVRLARRLGCPIPRALAAKRR